MPISSQSQRPGARQLAPSMRRWRAALACALALSLLLATFAASSQAENAEIAKRQAKQRMQFTDAEIVDGFFKIALNAEFRVAGRSDRIRKYDRPVRIYVDNRGKPDRRAQLHAIVADIGARIEHLDIAITEDRKAAQVVVTLVRERDLARTIRRLYGGRRARQIQKSLDPQCLSGFQKDKSYRIVHSEVILVVDASDFIFHDCAYEELLQALGPINDDPSVPWTMFNDDVQMGFFDVYDQYLLNILYDPRVRPGMSRKQLRTVMPEVLKSVRAWVAKINGLER
jgi:hypothetical protein